MPLAFDQDIVSLAQSLLGTRLTVRGVGGTVLEVEAYGRDDPASHSYRGPGLRNAAMFGAPGTVYVYLSYGAHLCLNVVGRPGEAVLVRAIRPEIGIPKMIARRHPSPILAAGPGRVGQALGVSLQDNGKHFGGGEFGLEPALPLPPGEVVRGARIGISKATDRLWRFGLAGDKGMSRPFPKPRD
jgi:DNA-3-methyladenine glycosylase